MTVKTSSKEIKAKKAARGEKVPEPKNGLATIGEQVEAKKERRQQVIPGTETKVQADIETAIEEYVDVRDERMRLSTEEGELKAKLIATLKKHKVENYRSKKLGRFAEIVHEEETVKVRKLAEVE